MFCSPGELRSIEQVVAGDEPEENKCEHFTIRGYVAEVRKRDTKICWPFSTLRNQYTPGEDAVLLPPLSVTKYRWWNCRKCRGETFSSESVRANEAVMDYTPNDDENAIEGRAISEETQRQPYDSAFTASEERRERNTVISADTFAISSHCEDDPEMVLAKDNEKISIRRIAGAELSGIPMSKGTNVAASDLEDDQGVSRIRKMKEPSGKLISIAAHMSNHDSTGLDKDSEEASEIDMGSVDKMVRSRNNGVKLDKLAGKLQHKKARKVCLLNDIMRNEKFLMSGRTHNFEGDAKSIENDDDKRLGTSKGEAQSPEHGNQFVDRKIEVNHTKRKNRVGTLQIEGGKRSLMHSMKKMPRRGVIDKRDVQTNTVDCSIGESEYAADILAEIHLGPNKRRTIVDGRQSMLPQVKAERPFLLLQQDGTTAKSYAPENSRNDHLRQKSRHSSANVMVNEKILHHDLKIQDITHQRDIISNRKRKAHKVDDGQFYQMCLPKLQGKVIKKRRTMRIWDKGAVDDDIPMDIVELLAKNLHQRRLMNAEHATKSISDASKHGCIMDVAKCHGNKASDSAYNKATQQKKPQPDSARHGVWGPGKNSENVYCRPKAYRPPSIGNLDNYIDPNQQELLFTSTRSHEISQSGAELPVIRPYEDSLDRMKMQPSGSHCRDQMISDQNSGRKSHDASGINAQKIDSNFDHLNMGSNNKSLECGVNTVVHKTDWQKPSNIPDKQIQDRKRKHEPSLGPRIPAAPNVMEAGTTESVYQFTNMDMPASDLLRLMDRTVWSGGTFQSSDRCNELPKEITNPSDNSRPHSNSKWADPSVVSISQTRDGNEQVELKYKEAPCVVNRNPADFCMPDEDCVYMRGREEEDLRPGYLPTSGSRKHPVSAERQKQRKVMKITALKRFMREK